MKRCRLVGAFLIALSASGFGQEARNESSPCPSFPCVVASIALTDQTMSVSQVPIYTPPATGLFRVVYYEESLPSGPGYWIFTWNWTDDLKTEAFGPYELYPGDYFNDGIWGMRVLAGTPITYTVTRSGGPGTYDLFATVEQLQ